MPESLLKVGMLLMTGSSQNIRVVAGIDKDIIQWRTFTASGTVGQSYTSDSTVWRNLKLGSYKALNFDLDVDKVKWFALEREIALEVAKRIRHRYREFITPVGSQWDPHDDGARRTVSSYHSGGVQVRDSLSKLDSPLITSLPYGDFLANHTRVT